MGDVPRICRLGALRLYPGMGGATARAWLVLVFVSAALVRCAAFGETGSVEAVGDANVPEGGDAPFDVGVGAGDSAPIGPVTSCTELRGATSRSDIYTLSRADAAAFEVYCDMETNDGGWTLVARSVDNASGSSFGWMQSRGDVRNDAVPYSLDVRKLAPFTALLAGRRDAGKRLVTSVYKKDVPPDFLTTYSTTDVKNSTMTVTGTCAPDPSGPYFLAYFGFTERIDYFHFRDVAGPGMLGLLPGGWNSNGINNCLMGGDLNGQQAEIFVR